MLEKKISQPWERDVTEIEQYSAWWLGVTYKKLYDQVLAIYRNPFLKEQACEKQEKKLRVNHYKAYTKEIKKYTKKK